LDKKAGSYCKLMTGLSRRAVECLWERYGQYFEDAVFTVTPVALKTRPRTTAQPPSPASSSSVASSGGPESDSDVDMGDGDDENGGDSDNDEDADSDEQPLTQPQEPVYLRRQGRVPTLPPKDRLYLLLRALRTGETQSLLADRFGVNSLCRAT
jgi:hypothetical protein